MQYFTKTIVLEKLSFHYIFGIMESVDDFILYKIIDPPSSLINSWNASRMSCFYELSLTVSSTIYQHIDKIIEFIKSLPVNESVRQVDYYLKHQLIDAFLAFKKEIAIYLNKENESIATDKD